MKAAVYHGPQNMTVEEIPVSEPGKNQVRVQVKYLADMPIVLLKGTLWWMVRLIN